MTSGSHLILYTDLDGTLLDHATYSPAEAEAVLARAQRSGVPVVFCSSKTRAEIEVLRERLSVRDPFIVENGGAVVIPDGCFPDSFLTSGDGVRRRGEDWIIELGAPYDELVAALRRLRTETGIEALGFGDMTVAEVAAKAHMTLTEAGLARAREYDEPFILLDENTSAVEVFSAAVECAGLRMTRGGRFHHLHGCNSDKGEAVRRLTRLYRRLYGCIETAALGDSENDLPMLAEVDRPMLVRRRDGSYDSAVADALPGMELIDGIGPQGWAAAVTSLLFARSRVV
ncbi:MAG: HAD-IIB family hydrolase [Blastocatellales bacterium]|nr:HAD-IIB family hydrolase [Blastocatellales bacterium]